MALTYQQAGVDIDAGNDAVNRIKPLVHKTFSQHVLTGLGSFGSLFDIASYTEGYRHPVLVQSIDSVGTKVMIAHMAGSYASLGKDIVGHSANDVLAQGARPITFLDYLAFNTISPSQVEELVSGMVEVCSASNISLVGGETAELPGVYAPGEFDLVGCVSGIVEKDRIITGNNITDGDSILGFASNGLHTNGFSLARKIFFDIGGYQVGTHIPELGMSLGDALLAPHTNYADPVLHLLDNGHEIKGIAHITGGGFIENIPRVLPAGVSAHINRTSWPVLPIFTVMQQQGQIEEHEMFRTFNMGIGLVLIVSKEGAEAIKKEMKLFPSYELYEIGRIMQGNKEVQFV